MAELKNWYLQEANGRIAGHGYVYQSPKFAQGTKIHTSAVEGIDVDDEHSMVILTTKSGSRYHLDFVEIDKAHREDTAKAIEKAEIFLDIDKCVESRRRRIEAVLAPRELFVRMAGGWNALEAYFETIEHEIVNIPVTFHSGDFSDSVLIGNELCDWKFFPYGSRIECYHWSDGIATVKLENVSSKDFIFRGLYRDILCRQGEITAVGKEEFAGEGLVSPDAVRMHTGEMLTQDEIVRLLSQGKEIDKYRGVV